MKTHDGFEIGDVLVEAVPGLRGRCRWVVVAFGESGHAAIDMVDAPNKYHPGKYELLACGRYIAQGERDCFIRVGKWDFANNLEVDDGEIR